MDLRTCRRLVCEPNQALETMSRRQKLWSSMLLGGAIACSGLVTGCGGPADGAGSPTVDQAIPTWEEFRASVPRDERGAYVVERDIPLFSEADLRAYYDAAVEEATRERDGIGVVREPLIVGQVNGQDDVWLYPYELTLYYCVDAASFSSAQVSALMPAWLSATDSWSRRIAVKFVPSCSDVLFKFTIRRGTVGNYEALSFYPHDNPDNRILQVYDTAFTTTAYGEDLDGILRHEIGHILGFRHEHNRIYFKDNLPSSCGGDDFPYRALTDYDEDSVMHYPQCRHSQAGGYRQTELDYAGAVALYKMAPALVSTFIY
jgi:hypothetical protein